MIKILDIDCKQAAQIALDNKLYVRGWLMKSFYEKILNGNVMNYSILLAYIDDEVVGAVTVSKLKKMVAVFVKKNYRKNGVGTKLLDSILQKTGLSKNEVFAGQGVVGSQEFYFKNKVVVIGSSDMLILQSSANDSANLIEKKLTNEGKREDEINLATVNEFFDYFGKYVKQNYNSLLNNSLSADYQTQCFKGSEDVN